MREEISLNDSLVKSLRKGDDQAWRTFFSRFDGLITSVVSWPKWHFESHVCEDVAQTAKTEIVKSIRRLQDESRLTGFVKRICVNRCIDEVRRQSRERGFLTPLASQNDKGEWRQIDPPADDRSDPVAAVIMMEQASALREALAKLAPPCRAVIRQFYVEGCAYKDIAKKEGVTVSTVGTRLARCLKKLKKLMEGGLT